ncbi:MAG: sodium:solute symporter family protein [Acidobacteriota bacterium]
MIDFGHDLLVWSAVYVVLLLAIGAWGRKAKRERTLSDHFLAGRSIGFGVLLLTLFATQYSGNSLSGFPGQTYREGISYFMSVTFMVGIVAGYLLFAPRLFVMARRGRYLTPTDFLAERFRSAPLNYFSAVIFSLTLCNYLLAQLMALGHAFSGLTGDQIPYWVGVVGGALVVLIYETLGGLRAVAWTDAIQGMILFIGLLLVVFLIFFEVGSPAALLESVREQAPEKIANPGWSTCFVWLSNFLLLALGAPLYPHAIQRIYAARKLLDLKRALAIMAFLPLFAISAVVFIGVAGIILFPDLERIASDRISFQVLGYLVQHNRLAYYPVLVVMMAVIAAIMSTVDSALLSLSSIFTKDFTARIRGLGDREAERLTRVAPLFSVLILITLVLIALRPFTTLWGLLVIKFEILIQLSPAFVLGTLHDREDPRAFSTREILTGLTLGMAILVCFLAVGIRSVNGLHAGTLAVAVNYGSVFLMRKFRNVIKNGDILILWKTSGASGEGSN